MIKLTKKILIQALDCAPLGMMIVRRRRGEWRIEYVNPAIETLTGYDASELIGERLVGLLRDGQEPGERLGAAPGTTNAVEWRTAQVWRCRNGMFREMQLKVSALFDRPGRAGYWLLSDVGIQEEAETTGGSLAAALRDTRMRLKRVDPMDTTTGVASENSFNSLLQRDWATARREQKRLSLILFRVNAFGLYRDLFGRHAADSCLHKVAHAISGLLRRADDVCARVGPDCFAAIVGNLDEQQARQFAEKIARRVRDLSIHHPRAPDGRYITVDFGVASRMPAWSESSNTLLLAAEADLDSRPGAPARVAGG